MQETCRCRVHVSVLVRIRLDCCTFTADIACVLSKLQALCGWVTFKGWRDFPFVTYLTTKHYYTVIFFSEYFHRGLLKALEIFHKCTLSNQTTVGG